jgi:AraC-like DNA-binding protein
VSQKFTAEGVPARSRVDYWRHVIGDMVGPMEPYGGLPRSLTATDTGPVRVVDIVVDRAGGVDRARRHIFSDDPELCDVDVVVRGQGAVEQDRRRADVTPGDFTIVDLARPARWDMSATRLVTLVFPWAMLRLDNDDLARLTAVPMRGTTGTAALASSLARGLADHLDGPGAVDPRAGSALVDLLSAALHARLDKRLPHETREKAIVHHVHRFIETHLHDAELSPATVAAAHHISLRYLYKLFALEGVTVARLIQQRRLEQCRHDLIDAAQATKPVSAIAARWGLPNAGHFSKLFRAAYGMTPTEFRARYGPRSLRREDPR